MGPCLDFTKQEVSAGAEARTWGIALLRHSGCTDAEEGRSRHLTGHELCRSEFSSVFLAVAIRAGAGGRGAEHTHHRACGYPGAARGEGVGDGMWRTKVRNLPGAPSAIADSHIQSSPRLRQLPSHTSAQSSAVSLERYLRSL